MNKAWRPAFVAVGSNLESPADQVDAAIALLDDLDLTRVTACSSLYRSKPLDESDQPDFVNAVVALDTALEPPELLERLQRIEHARGRDRSVARWGPRIIDLDLLAVGELVVDSKDLTIPHPGIAGRNFVLLPWAEIAPGYRIPGLKCVADLAREAPAEPPIEKLD